MNNDSSATSGESKQKSFWKRVSIIDDSEELIFKRVFYELTEPNNKNENQCYLFVNIKYKQSKKAKEPKLDDFEKSDKFFIEKLKKEGLLEKSGKRIRQFQKNKSNSNLD